MITVEYLADSCIVRYGESFSIVMKPIGEAIEKMVAENRQLKARNQYLEGKQ